MLTELPIASQPAVDASDVIFSTGDALIRVPVAGGEPVTIAQAQAPTAPIVLGTMAYFSAEMPVGSPDPNGKQQSAQRAFSVALAGGEPSSVPELDPFLLLAADGAALYLDTYGPDFKRWDPTSGELATLAHGAKISVDAISIYGDYVYVAAQDIGVGGFTNGVIGRIRKLGGSLEILVSGLGHPWNLVASQAGLYWSEDPPALYGAGPGRIAKSKLTGAAVTTISDTTATSLAFSRGRLFAALGSEIDSFPADGGTPTVLASGLSNAGMLTIAGANLVWVDPVDQALSSTDPTFAMTTCAAP